MRAATLARTDRAPLDLDLPSARSCSTTRVRYGPWARPPRPRCPPPDRGVHDRRQCLGGRDVEAKGSPLMSRLQLTPPSKEGSASLGEFLATIGLVARSQGRRKRTSTASSPIGPRRRWPKSLARGLAKPGPGRLMSPPFRPEPPPLRAFHLSDSPLRRPHRGSRLVRALGLAPFFFFFFFFFFFLKKKKKKKKHGHIPNRPERTRPETRAWETCADAVGKIGRNQPVGGLALGGHSSPLGIGDALRDLIEFAHPVRSDRLRPAPARGPARGAR